MTVGRFYILVWMAAIAAAGITFFTGNFNDLAAVIFGFTFSTIAFAGLFGVLPWWMDKFYRYDAR